MSVVLSFVTPPFGLAPLTGFVLEDVPGADGLFSLRSIDDADIRLFVIDAAVYLPDYSPEISDEQSALIDVTTAEDAMVLVVANPGGPEDSGTRMNLLAPIIVNVHTGACSQVILEGQDWPLQAELATRTG